MERLVGANRRVRPNITIYSMGGHIGPPLRKRLDFKKILQIGKSE